MKLKELCEVLNTQHFKIVVVENGKEAFECWYENYLNKKSIDEYKVVSIDSTTEIEKESPITHTISVRPILLVTIRG